MSVLQKAKSFQTFRYLLFFFALNAGWPSVFSFMGWLPEFHIGYLILATLSIVYALQYGKKLPIPITTIIVVQIITFVIYSAIFSDSSYITRCFYLVITYALLSIQMGRSKMEFVDTNVFWLTVQAAMGGVGFMLTLAGILKPISTFVEFDGHIGTFYGLYTSNALYDGMVRVAGFFDEPGAFAFWGIIALLFNKVSIDNKRVEKILIVGLVSTLSMAYFIQLALYTYLFYKNRISKLMVPVASFLILLTVIASYSPEMNHAIFGRFQVDETTGRLKGDNRSVNAEFCKDVWLTSPIIGVGAYNVIGISLAQGTFAGANPYTFLATDGIIGQFVLLLPLFYLFQLGNRNKKYRYVAYILLVGFLQRPYDPTQLLYPLLILTMGIEGYRETYKYGLIKRSDFATMSN